MLIDLSHPITDGMVTYPGLPAPIIGTHLSREAAVEVYGPGVTFHIGLVTICTNTGTYLDVPFHRFADGHDLAALPLERPARPVHTRLLGAQIPIVEHLTNLAALPDSGFRFTAVPPRLTGAGTFTVRAFATID